MSLMMPPTTSTTTATSSRNVRCLIVGGDLDMDQGSFALSVDEDMTIEQLQHRVLEHLPSTHQERIGSELQLFKGFDLYTSNGATQMTTPMKKARRSSLGASPIDELLQTFTPENTANKYFQKKYAMRKRASLGEYLPRGRKCERSRIDVLVSVPKFQLSEDVAAMESEPEMEEGDDHSFGFGFESSDADDSESASVTSLPLKRKRDPVVDEAPTRPFKMTPSKWQRGPCGRVMSVDTLRMRSCCALCRSSKQH